MTNDAGDRIQVGDISGTGIAVGRGASATVNTGIPAGQLDVLFAQMAEVAKGAAPEKRKQAEDTVQALKQEVAKGSKANDGTVAKLIDGLVELIPEGVSAVVSAFATPVVGAVVGPVTRFVLDKLRKD
jgi:hypothetical protein